MRVLYIISLLSVFTASAACTSAWAGSGSGWPASVTTATTATSQPGVLARKFTAVPRTITVATPQTSSNPISGYFREPAGEHRVYFSQSVPSTGWYEFKWRESSGTDHLTYIKAADLKRGANVIGFTVDAAALAKNEYKNLEGYTVKDPVNPAKIAALDISYIGADQQTQYYGTLDMNDYDRLQWGATATPVVSHPSSWSNDQILTLLSLNK